MSSFPQFRVTQFNAPDQNIGAVSSPLPCASGDVITFTATIQYLSGGMQPQIGIWFWDSLQETNYGMLLICPPNTDNGFHIYSFTVTVPVGAVTYTVQTQCAYITPGGVVNALTTANVYAHYSLEPIAFPVNNTTGMAVGQTVTISNPGGSYGVNLPIQALDPGVSFSAYNFSRNFVAGSPVVNAYPPESCFFVGFLPPGVVEPSDASETSWAISDYRLTQNGTPIYAPLIAYSGSLTSYSTSQQFVPPLYYLSLFTSLYKAAPNLYAWNATKFSVLIDIMACTQQMYQAFNLATATGELLDIIGAIVGAPRQLPFQPSGYSSILEDADYSILIQAKIAQNQWNGQVGSIYTMWNQLYPGSNMVLLDNQNMTATIILAAPSLSPLQLQIIEAGLIIPRPQGVLYTFTTATEPIFGADLDTSIVAGADLGHAS